MPKPRKKDEIVCQYYRWLLGRRGDVYFADGRANHPPLGRHSLGTKDRAEALVALQKLDVVMAVRARRLDRSILDEAPAEQLGLEKGWQQYRDHVARPRVTGGAGLTTIKRYRAVGDKFLSFARSLGITAWIQVNRQTLEAYARHLESLEYAHASLYLELTTLKQAVKFFVDNGLLPPTCRITLPMRKSEETDTYCWKPAEVSAIVDHCRKDNDLDWLGDVVVGLACTGLRISELAGLRWSDIDLQNNMITLTDESTRAPSKTRRKARIMKSKRSRSLPIHSELEALLRQVSRAADGYVFRAVRGGRIKPDRVREVLIRDVLKPLAKTFPTAEGEIGFVDGRLHSFRHYFCSLCANTGVPEQVLMTWLGHTNSRMIKRYYHLHNAEAQQQMQKLKPVSKAVRKRQAG
jgi:integrase